MKKYLFDIVSDALKKLNYPDCNYLVEYSKDKNFGDFSCNLPLMLAKTIKGNAKELAKEISDNIKFDSEKVKSIEIAGSGFINFFIQVEYFKKEVIKILSEKQSYGKLQINSNKKANLEWVSANPTGLLHAGHGRQICLGKAIANLLEWTGYEVTREYYYNDAGNQMKKLAESIKARYIQNTTNPDFPFPEDGYHSDNILDIVNIIKEKYTATSINLENTDFFQKIGEEYNFNKIKKSLKRLSINHDIFFSETSLYDSGEINELLLSLEKRNLTYDKEGAKWIRIPESEGLTGDKVLIKSSGDYTYRLPDMAYHINKIKRGFDLIIDIFGSDHKDTYKEVLYGVQSAGFNTGNIKVIIHQMVTFKEGEKSVKMSKRSDKVYYLEDLLNDVGEDATQFFFIMRNSNSHLVFDIELAKEHSENNPVYYLQYAYARICGILRNFDNLQLDSNNLDSVNLNLLNSEEEIDLIKAIVKFPDEVFNASKTLEPHKLITYLNNLAENFHKFYHNHRVFNAETSELSHERMLLCQATKQVLNNGFQIIGISAPERM